MIEEISPENNEQNFRSTNLTNNDLSEIDLTSTDFINPTVIIDPI